MDIAQIIASLVAVIGTGGLGGYLVAAYKARKEAALAEKKVAAQIEQSRKDSELEEARQRADWQRQIEESQRKFIDELQEQNHTMVARMNEQDKKLSDQAVQIAGQAIQLANQASKLASYESQLILANSKINLLEAHIISHGLQLPYPR